MQWEEDGSLQTDSFTPSHSVLCCDRMPEKHPRLLIVLLAVLVAFLALKLGLSSPSAPRGVTDAPAVSAKAPQRQTLERGRDAAAAKESVKLGLAKPARSGDPFADQTLQLDLLRE